MATTLTNINPNDPNMHGYYQFANLCAGTYKVSIDNSQPALAGFSPTTPNAPSSTTSNDSNPNPATVVLPANNSSDQTTDFGYIFCNLEFIGGIDLGKASTGAVIGLANTNIINSNVTIVGDEYVSQGGTISNMAPSTVTGNVFQFAARQYPGPGKLAGSLIINPALLMQVDNDALSASAAAKALRPTQTFGSITKATTIFGNGGQNVIRINGDIKKNLTLSGSANDTFIINVTGTLTLGGSDAIALSGGVTANNVLVNFSGTGGTISTHVGNVINGTMLAPTYSFDLDGVFDGSIIGGGSAITFKSGAKVNQRACP